MDAAGERERIVFEPLRLDLFVADVADPVRPVRDPIERGVHVAQGGFNLRLRRDGVRTREQTALLSELGPHFLSPFLRIAIWPA